MIPARTYAAFEQHKLVVSGDFETIFSRIKALKAPRRSGILIFEDQTGRQVDFDFRRTAADVIAEMTSEPRPTVGRPKLGVVSREVTLLPRHWEWLEAQPNGISAAIRRLVDEARKQEPQKENARLAREAAGKFMWAIAGNLPHFEEASRALFAKDRTHFEQLIVDWPKDIRKHLLSLVVDAM